MAKKSEIGYSGLNRWAGVINEDFLSEMRHKYAYRRYNEMRLNSPVVGALMLSVEQAIRGIDWQVTSEAGEDDERIEFIQTALDGMSMSWNDHVIEALTMLPFGFAIFEKVYKRDEAGKLVWRKLAPRGQDTVHEWQIADDGGIEGVWQSGAPTYKKVFIPIDKMLLYRTRVEKNNPEGRSILRTAWVPYYYQKNIQQIEAIGIERDLAGLPVIKLPTNADTTDSDTSDYGKARTIVRNIRRDEQEGIVLPPEWELELLSTGGSRQFDTDKVINRYESRILMSALAQFLLLGQEGVGSLALSSDQSDFFTMSVNATADIISETFTKFAIPQLLLLNGYDDKGLKLEHGPAGDINLAELAQFLQAVGDKITWMPADEVWLRGAAKLPEADAEEIEIEREARREEAMLMFQRSKPAPGETKEDEADKDKPPPNKDDMTAQLFAVDLDLDDRIRRSHERKLFRLIKGYWVDQEQRIIKAARKLK